MARGLAVSLSKRFDEAEQEFEQAMRLDPQLFDAVYWFARARQSQGRFQDALNLFERAAVLRPEDYQVPGFIAQALKSLGRDDEATASRRKGNRN